MERDEVWVWEGMTQQQVIQYLLGMCNAWSAL